MLKLKLLFVFIICCFFVILSKLFYIQVLSAHNYAGEYLQTNKIHPERGRILDSHGQPLAVNETKYLLYVEPKRIEKASYLAKDLDGVLKLGEATIEARIDETKDWVKITSGVTKEQKDALARLKIEGIGFQEEPDRYYPESSLSAHILGFVGKTDEGENTGYFGIEGYYEKELAGLPGLLKSERDLIGRPIFFGTQEKVDPQHGGDIELTIDSAVQSLVKKKLVKGMESYGAKEGCVIVADPFTMSILSLACVPDFDPEKYYEFGEDVFKNPAISNVYEPGSTFKPLVIAAGIEEKAIKPDETMNEEGPVTIGEHSVRTWNNQYEGRVSMTRILEKSSNVGMVYVGNKLGNDRLYKYLQKFRFGKATGIDLQGEVASYLKSQDEMYEIDYATATFGQGIAVTPLQMVRAFSAVINGGYIMQPHIVQKITSDGMERVQEPKVVERIFSDRTSEIVKKMLVSTVENGDSKWVKPTGYTVGGKTGTAQIPIEGRYDPNKTIVSFIGFAPATKPKFIALVVLREPKSSPWGSETAAPLFFDIARDLLLYYNIAPDKDIN